MPKRGLADAGASELAHYLGHGDRLRERFREGGDSLPDYELLESRYLRPSRGRTRSRWPSACSMSSAAT